jgi:hypothetical protein
MNTGTYKYEIRIQGKTEPVASGQIVVYKP